MGCVRYAGRCIPAAAVGGDLFGYFPRSGNRNGVDSMIGDVSGHGVGAALLMAEARTMFMAERLVAPNAAQILAKLNDLLYPDLDRAGFFITACCAIFDATTRELSYANAGHPPALLLRAAESSCCRIDADGLVLGIREGVEFTDVKVKLETGDIVVFHTDGITEMQNAVGEMFGVDRLREAVARSRNEDPETVVAKVLAALEEFAGGVQPEDDLTIVVMKLTG
jgi:sigma-B regulation protein RsbU (phosphoserine phosphatase)